MARIVSVAARLEDFRSRLRNRRWRFISSGGFGSCYGRGGLVWKTEVVRRDYWQGNVCHSRFLSGWAAYVKAIAAGRLRGPHLPRVRLVIEFEDGVAALMERLPLSFYDANLEPSFRSNMRDLLERSLSNSFTHVDRLRGRPHWTEEEVNEQVERLHEGIRAMPKSLKSFARTLARWAEVRGLRLDCHQGNVMARADGTLVVIDPVV